MARNFTQISPSVKVEGRAIWTLSADGTNRVYGETIRKRKGMFGENGTLSVLN